MRWCVEDADVKVAVLKCLLSVLSASPTRKVAQLSGLTQYIIFDSNHIAALALSIRGTDTRKCAPTGALHPPWGASRVPEADWSTQSCD